MSSTLIKTMVTEVKGKYFKGEIEDKGTDTVFVLENIKVPRKNPASPQMLTLEEMHEFFAEVQAIKDVLDKVHPKVTSITPLTANSEKIAHLAGAKEAVSNLDIAYDIENSIVKVSGQGKVVTQFEWYYGDTSVQEQAIYFVIELKPSPNNTVSSSGSKLKVFNLDGTEKIVDFVYNGDGYNLFQRITKDNKESGREIEIAWDGVNYQPIKLDFSGVTGLV